jgi:hypothetical protein
MRTMKYIANILTDEQFSEDELYNVVQDRDSLVPNIPTLIIGWEKTKGLYPDASIIEWKVAENVYWTYGKYERRDKYEVNVKKFNDLALKKFIDSVYYVFYDVIKETPERFEKFIELLLSNMGKTIYITGDMMYINYDGMTKVVGVSLRDCDYVDETYKKRIFSAMYNNPSVILLKNNDAISKEVRFKTRGRAYILPYLYS